MSSVANYYFRCDCCHYAKIYTVLEISAYNFENKFWSSDISATL
jgi:hypothetical protein